MAAQTSQGEGFPQPFPLKDAAASADCLIADISAAYRRRHCRHRLVTASQGWVSLGRGGGGVEQRLLLTEGPVENAATGLIQAAGGCQTLGCCRRRLLWCRPKAGPIGGQQRVDEKGAGAKVVNGSATPPMIPVFEAEKHMKFKSIFELFLLLEFVTHLGYNFNTALMLYGFYKKYLFSTYDLV